VGVDLSNCGRITSLGVVEQRRQITHAVLSPPMSKDRDLGSPRRSSMASIAIRPLGNWVPKSPFLLLVVRMTPKNASIQMTPTNDIKHPRRCGDEGYCPHAVHYIHEQTSAAGRCAGRGQPRTTREVSHNCKDSNDRARASARTTLAQRVRPLVT
jgi:hypothetical protein